MLHLILGPVGSGKTTRLYEVGTLGSGREKPSSWCRNNTLFLKRKSFVPAALAPLELPGLEVLSFTRLCDRIFREYGGLAVNALTDTGKAMLMSPSPWGGAGHLANLCPAGWQRLALWRACAPRFRNLKTAGSHQRSYCCRRESGDAQLREKAAELSTIYEVYNALLESRYTDTADDLQRACRLVEDHPFCRIWGVCGLLR